MYHECYEKMVAESRIAIKMPEEIWLDKDGVVVEEEHLAFGRNMMSHPKYWFFIRWVMIHIKKTMATLHVLIMLLEEKTER